MNAAITSVVVSSLMLATLGCPGPEELPTPPGPPAPVAPVEPEQPEFGEIRTVSSPAEVQKAVDDNATVVLCVSASWCTACKQLDPEYKKVAQKLKNVLFLKADGSEHPEVKRIYQVTAYPTVIVFSKKAERTRKEGVQSARQLESWVKSFSR